MDKALKEVFGPLVLDTPPSLPQDNFPTLPTESVLVSVGAQKSAGCREYSEKEWEARKQMIQRLYSVGTLRATIIALKEDGFPVTTKQLKRRVMAWGFRKNLTRDEREALVRKQAHAKTLAGEDTFALDNPLKKVITPARLERMMKREGIALDEAPDAVATPPTIKHGIAARDMAAKTTVSDNQDAQKSSKASNEAIFLETLHCKAVSVPSNFASPHSPFLPRGSHASSDEVNAENGFLYGDERLSDASNQSITLQRVSLQDSEPEDDAPSGQIICDDIAIVPDMPSTTNSEMVRYQSPEEQVITRYRTTGQDMFAHDQRSAMLHKELSEVLISLGFDEEEDNRPKAGSKRKRRSIYITWDASTSSSSDNISNAPNRKRFRVSVKEWMCLKAFGFSLVKQPDDSISMILPPLFDNPYRLDTEIKHRERVCEMDRIYGSEDQRTLDALFNFTIIINLQRRDSQGLTLNRWEAARRRKIFGDGHQSTIEAFLMLTKVLIQNKCYSEAGNLLRWLHSSATYYLGVNCAIALHIRLLNASILSNNGNYGEAEIEIRDILEASRECHNYGMTIDCYCLLEFALRDQGKFTECKKILEDAIRLAEEIDKDWSAMAILYFKRYKAFCSCREGLVGEGDQLHNAVNRELEILRPGIDPWEPIGF